jgi:3',5'-cyclic AMP phosphodiesterase CpdA
MPIHLLPSATSRRRFISNVASLASGVILGAGLRPRGLLQGQESLSDSHEAWALLSDTHIDGDVATNARGINMADHLRQAVGEVLQAHAQRPFAGLMINGDCAYLEGKSDDYSTLGSLIQPVSAQGIPIHLTLGNHDERTRIQTGLANVFEPAGSELKESAQKQRAPLVHKLASKVRGRFCDWYLLDSLDVTNKTPGTLGAEQLEWLEKSLKAAADRPALVMVHHNPQPAGFGKVLGLTDTEALLNLLLEQRQVKALFFGHTHVASTREIEGLHLVNLPACAYHFSEDQPTGWTSARVSSSGCILTLQDTAKAHALHAQEVSLTWRS